MKRDKQDKKPSCR